MHPRWLALAATTVMLGELGLARAQDVRPEPPPWQAFLTAGGSDRRQAQAALDDIAVGRRDGYAAMIVDVARFLPSPRTVHGPDESPSLDINDAGDVGQTGGPPRGGDVLPTWRQPAGADARRRLTTFVERHTRQRFGDDLRAWRRWMWALPYAPHPDYSVFKAELYARIDPRFRAFFPPRVKADIRLDEIDRGRRLRQRHPAAASPPRRSRRPRRAGCATATSCSGSSSTGKRAPTRSAFWPGTRWRPTGWVASISRSSTARCAAR